MVLQCLRPEQFFMSNCSIISELACDQRSYSFCSVLRSCYSLPAPQSTQAKRQKELQRVYCEHIQQVIIVTISTYLTNSVIATLHRHCNYSSLAVVVVLIQHVLLNLKSPTRASHVIYIQCKTLYDKDQEKNKTKEQSCGKSSLLTILRVSVPLVRRDPSARKPRAKI